MDEAFKAITVASRRQQDYDDTDFFCQMLAKKMKKMDEKKRDKLMYDIHTLLYNSNYNEYQSSPTTTYSDSSVEYYVPPNPAAGYSYNQASAQVYAVSTPTATNQPVYTSQPSSKIIINSQEIIQKAFEMSGEGVTNEK